MQNSMVTTTLELPGSLSACRPWPHHGNGPMLRSKQLRSTLTVAGIALVGVLVRAADSPEALFGLGTDFISGFMFGMAIMLAVKAVSGAQSQS